MADAAQEFFYLDDDGVKQDAELHNPIINAADEPIDEKIMGPIRARNRAKWLAEQDKQKAGQKAAQKQARLQSQWQRTKARAQARLKYDDSEPRDEHGRWSGGGGGSDSEGGVAGYSPGVKARGTEAVNAVREQWVRESPVKNLDDVVKAAPVAQNNFAASAEKIAAKLGISFKNPGPKTHDKEGNIKQSGVDRIRQKLAERKNAPAARITDTARGTFVLNHPDDAEKVIGELAKTHEIAVEPWRTIPDTHYTDRALLFRDRQTGAIGEVQLTEQKMADAKSPDGGGGHDLYKVQRDLPKGDPGIEKLNGQMRQLYGGVLDGYKGTPWAKVDGRVRP